MPNFIKIISGVGHVKSYTLDSAVMSENIMSNVIYLVYLVETL